MADQSDRDALRAELIRLLSGLEFYRSWVIAAMEREHGALSKADLDQIVMPGSFFLDTFDKTPGSRCVEVLEEIQRWYAHTASDFAYLAENGGAARADEIRQFINDFRKTVGFSFHAEAGVLRKSAEKVLKRRKVTTEREYRLLRELEDDLSQTVLSPEKLENVRILLREVEARTKVG